jgi:methylated-DNA-[protein]-cysteine S-methyltransferase
MDILYLRKYYNLHSNFFPDELYERVYLATMCIPRGYVTTYGNIATLLSTEDKKINPRTIGLILSKNPWAPYVPCHRIVASKGIGGFFGSVDDVNVNRKRILLIEEGVRFDGTKVDSSRILSWQDLHNNIYISRQ